MINPEPRLGIFAIRAPDVLAWGVYVHADGINMGKKTENTNEKAGEPHVCGYRENRNSGG